VTNPLKALLALPELSATAFPPTSRYYAVETATRETADGTVQIYLRRRFVPDPDKLALLSIHRVALGDRLDLLAYASFGNPELFWRICDANGALRPSELIESIGRRLRICEAESSGGAANG